MNGDQHNRAELSVARSAFYACRAGWAESRQVSSDLRQGPRECVAPSCDIDRAELPGKFDRSVHSNGDSATGHRWANIASLPGGGSSRKSNIAHARSAARATCRCAPLNAASVEIPQRDKAFERQSCRWPAPL